MLSVNELLVIGAALVRTIRDEYIPFSTNQLSVWEGYTDTLECNKRRRMIRTIRDERENVSASSVAPQDGSMEVRYKGSLQALEQGVGLCQELSEIMMYMTQYLSIGLSEVYHLTLVRFPRHAWVLIHQSQDVFFDQRVVAPNLEIMSQIASLQNAVIVDPWIYKATPLSQYQVLLDQAKEFDVFDYYDQKAITKLDLNIRIGVPYRPKVSVHDLTNKVIQSFEQAREMQMSMFSGSLGLPAKHRFAKGMSIREVQSKLSRYILRKYVRELIEFIEALSRQSSCWHSISRCADRKGQRYRLIIQRLQNFQPENIRSDMLVNILKSAIRIAPIVRGKITPARINFNNITMTKTANGLFSMAVVPRYNYSFEDIPEMKLDFIRELRANRNHLTRRERYRELIFSIYDITEDQQLTIERTLYMLYSRHGQAGLYAEVNHAINANMTEVE